VPSITWSEDETSPFIHRRRRSVRQRGACRADGCADMAISVARSLGYRDGIEDMARIVAEKTGNMALVEAQERRDAGQRVIDAAIAAG
jgi:hypothetical protein